MKTSYKRMKQRIDEQSKRNIIISKQLKENQRLLLIACQQVHNLDRHLVRLGYERRVIEQLKDHDICQALKGLKC